MKFNESEKLQIAVAYATSKACKTLFQMSITCQMNFHLKTGIQKIDTGLEPVTIDTDAILVQYHPTPDSLSVSVGIFLFLFPLISST